MLEPTVTPRPSVVALAASIALLGLGLGGCWPEPAEPVKSPVPAPPAQLTVATTPVAALDRAGLLAAMDAAASAYASGSESGEASLSGRRFVIRQVFGCAGEPARHPAATAADGVPTASRSEDLQSLRLTLTPGDWTDWTLITDGGNTSWEAVEGVWLMHPWLRTDDCPRAPASDPVSDPAALLPQTMGLASVFDADSSRLGRRNGRAYDHMVRGADDQPTVAPAQGYRLVLEGRLAAFPEGRAVRCRASRSDQRPTCIAAVQVDRVAFEDATGAVLSEWRGG